MQDADEVERRDDPRRHREEELERVVQLLGVDASHAFAQTETCFVLSLVNGSRFQPLQRSRKRHPGEPRHQVELRRGHRAERNREATSAPN